MDKNSFSLYVVRHAIAAERGDAFPDDSKRPLTSAGKAKFKKAARGLAEIGVEVDRILTSPYTRARETADILAAQLSGHPPVIETRALEPGRPFEHLLEALAEHADCRAVAIVGHEPGIGECAGRLVAAPALEFKKGAMCRIDFDTWPSDAPGVLRWFVTPKILTSTGR